MIVLTFRLREGKSYYLAHYFIKAGDDKRAIKELTQMSLAVEENLARIKKE